MKETFEMGFEGITNCVFVAVLLHRDLAGSGNVHSEQKQQILAKGESAPLITALLNSFIKITL